MPVDEVSELYSKTWREIYLEPGSLFSPPAISNGGFHVMMMVVNEEGWLRERSPVGGVQICSRR